MKFNLNDRFIINGTQLGYLLNAVDTKQEIIELVEAIIKKGKINR